MLSKRMKMILACCLVTLITLRAVKIKRGCVQWEPWGREVGLWRALTDQFILGNVSSVLLERENDASGQKE